jgi:hypothetical protein
MSTSGMAFEAISLASAQFQEKAAFANEPVQGQAVEKEKGGAARVLGQLFAQRRIAHRVDAPGSWAGEDEIEEDEAV